MTFEELYLSLILQLQYTELPFGLYVNDGPHLRGLVALSHDTAVRANDSVDAVYGICHLVLGTLPSRWTFFDFGKTSPEMQLFMPKFPDDFGEHEQLQWKNTYGVERMIDLDEMLAHGIGICASYAITLAICLKMANAAEHIWLCWRPGHVWVETDLSTDPNPFFDPSQIDISNWSHGICNKQLKPDWRYELAFDSASKIVPVP